MNYEIVNLEQKIVVGVNTKTGNDDPEMTKKIGSLWQDLFGKNIFFGIQNKVNAHSIGLYSDYTENGYEVTVGCEVSENANKELTEKIIPAGKYAKFVVQGDPQKAVGEAWSAIWSMPLDRTFAADFEEYTGAGPEDPIEIYIAIR